MSGQNFILREIDMSEYEQAMSLVLNTFNEYIAPDYSKRGVDTFTKLMNSDDFKHKFENKEKAMLGCFDENQIIGVLFVRDKSHISLFFVKKEYHHKGVGKNLFEFLVKDLKEHGIHIVSVNSSPYAVDFYHKLGFNDIDTEITIDGIRSTPMEFII